MNSEKNNLNEEYDLYDSNYNMYRQMYLNNPTDELKYKMNQALEKRNAIYEKIKNINNQ